MSIKKIIYNYRIIAQKLAMLNQGVKTIFAEFIRTLVLSQLYFVQFKPYATSFPELLLTLALMWKSKKTQEKMLDLTSRVKGLVSNVDYLENWSCNFKTNMAEKDICRAHTFHSLDCNFSFCTDFLHHSWLLKVKN